MDQGEEENLHIEAVMGQDRRIVDDEHTKYRTECRLCWGAEVSCLKNAGGNNLLVAILML